MLRKMLGLWHFKPFLELLVQQVPAARLRVWLNREQSVKYIQWNYSVQFSSVAQSCPTLCDAMIAARQASLSIINSGSSLRLASIESVMLSSHLILCHPLLLLPSVFPNIRVFSNKSVFPIRWPNYWSFSFSISPFNEYLRLISFRIDWFKLLAVQFSSVQSLSHLRLFATA